MIVELDESGVLGADENGCLGFDGTKNSTTNLSTLLC